MKKTTLKKLISFIKEEEKNYSFNDYIMNYIDEKELLAIEDKDELREILEKINENYELTNTEIVYYASAMEYLSREDNSLRESLEIANEYWYDIKNLNSELLASLLISRHNLEDYYTITESIIDFYDDIE